MRRHDTIGLEHCVCHQFLTWVLWTSYSKAGRSGYDGVFKERNLRSRREIAGSSFKSEYFGLHVFVRDENESKTLTVDTRVETVLTVSRPYQLSRSAKRYQCEAGSDGSIFPVFSYN